MTAFDILLAPFILLIVGASMVAKMFTRRKHHRLLREFTPPAREAGWKIEGIELEGPAIRITGETRSGVAWEMIVAGRDPQGRPLSRWRCKEILLEKGGVLIGYVPRGAGIGDIDEELTPEEMRAEVLWRMAEGRFGDDAPEGVVPFAFGSLEFQEHFVVLASEEEDPPLLLDVTAEAFLLEWVRDERREEVPLILFSSHGLVLSVDQPVRFTTLQDLARLGSMMVERALAAGT